MSRAAGSRLADLPRPGESAGSRSGRAAEAVAAAKPLGHRSARLGRVPGPPPLRIAYVAAGAAGMYCGSCIHDNTLAAALIERGHEVALLPTYTPIRTDEVDVSRPRVFYGAVNVYLEQKVPGWARAPRALRRLLDRRPLLRWISRFSTSTDAKDLGALTLSVLQGESGRQARELEELVDWLARWRPQVVQLTNAMFLGLARSLRERLGVPIVCGLPGEDLFLDQLAEPWHERVMAELRSRAGDVDAFLAPNLYYAERMAPYLGVARELIHVVPLGVRIPSRSRGARPRSEGPVAVGYLARICPEKGLHVLAEAFRELAGGVGPEAVHLRIGGYLGDDQRPFLESLVRRFAAWGLAERVTVDGELDAQAKERFLDEIDVLSVPTTYRESKGLYVLEALARGVPVVQPRHGAFPELVEGSGGGLLVEPESPESLAAGLARLVRDPGLRRRLGAAGAAAVRDRWSAASMARATEAVYRGILATGQEEKSA